MFNLRSLAIVSTLSFLAACSSGGGKDAGGENDAGQDSGIPDAGPFDAGFKCTFDDDCAALNPATRCDGPSGTCVLAETCDQTSDCAIDDTTSYCDLNGIGCRCVVGANDAGRSGVCRRIKPSCAPCSRNEECGSESYFSFPQSGTCSALPGGDGGTFCTKKAGFGGCKLSQCGYIDNGAGYCVPQAPKTCEAPGCSKDTDCPSGTVCNVQECICESRCRWDFAKQEVAAPGCGSVNGVQKTCWVDNEALDPTSSYYGSGRCRLPCQSDTDCTNTTTNKHGGPRLKCAAEKLADGTLSGKRCRAAGPCMDDLECPQHDGGAEPAIGYCDRGTFQCKKDCRIGQDPVTTLPFKDCVSSYACANDGGTNYCRLQTCLEQGGAAGACRRGQYCCGEDKNGDGQPDPCPPTGLEPNKCYEAPRPPFCTACMKQEDCDKLTLPAYLTGAGACANGSKSPSCSPLPMQCVYAGNRGMAMGINICAPSTWNDGTVTGGVGKNFRGCPTGFNPVLLRPKFVQGENYCNVDSDCNIGTDAGLCGKDPYISLQDGGHPGVCLCKFGGPNTCPNQEDAGLTSVCNWTPDPNVQQPCITSVACMPSPTVVYGPLDAGYGACGL